MDVDEETFEEEETDVVSHGWVCGQLPSARAGIAVTTTQGVEALIFGGAKYVHKRW